MISIVFVALLAALAFAAVRSTKAVKSLWFEAAVLVGAWAVVLFDGFPDMGFVEGALRAYVLLGIPPAAERLAGLSGGGGRTAGQRDLRWWAAMAASALAGAVVLAVRL
ncbi:MULTISPECIES: hypothetical protein [Streptomyces]|uniref:Uncharacterized protein n=1 Tax=Streptomyces sp. NBC_00093 TaxID=2975649 RepID=A0AAU1ZZJ5_9ACTN